MWLVGRGIVTAERTRNADFVIKSDSFGLSSFLFCAEFPPPPPCRPGTFLWLGSRSWSGIRFLGARGCKHVSPPACRRKEGLEEAPQCSRLTSLPVFFQLFLLQLMVGLIQQVRFPEGESFLSAPAWRERGRGGGNLPTGTSGPGDPPWTHSMTHGAAAVSPAGTRPVPNVGENECGAELQPSQAKAGPGLSHGCRFPQSFRGKWASTVCRSSNGEDGTRWGSPLSGGWGQAWCRGEGQWEREWLARDKRLKYAARGALRQLSCPTGG